MSSSSETRAFGVGVTEDDIFVQSQRLPVLPAPVTTSGPIGWLRANLFSSPLNTLLTLVILGLLILVIPPVIRFLFIDAVWSGTDRDACLGGPNGEVGACWAFVRERLPYFIYGSYPIPQRWRVDLFFVMLAFGAGWLLWLDAPRRGLGAIYFFIIMPICAYVLLNGWPLIGLPAVDTSLWGGVLVTVVVTTVGMVASLPFGILLALGRRSSMPAVRVLSIMFIEFVRGVPLITVLFFATYMLPLFLPGNFTVDGLVRALIGIALFAGAYQAEVVRGGLQAIPRGQSEAASALGLSWWKTTALIVLPQALRHVIPGLVNSFIALFKDTSLVSIVALFDLLGQLRASFSDPNWATPTTLFTGFAFTGMIYFAFCFGMSRYSLFVENRLNAHRRN